MQKLLLLLTLFFSLFTSAQEVAIIPKPVKLQVHTTADKFFIDAKTELLIQQAEAEPAARFLHAYIKEHYGLNLIIKPRGSGVNAIQLSTKRIKGKTPGMYTLRSAKRNIRIEANEETGLFYGVQSLIQLLPVSGKLEEGIAIVTIEDHPRFPYRGLHLDVSRHIFPLAFIKK